ncbi:MarR family transcriptional regulator, partial [Myxococcota bacterium]|nr:MarR family transcriptional regulator [Myxococcota bacterium]
KTHKLGPSAQAALLYSLYNEDEDGLTPSGLADTLHYSPMTLSRAFDQLEATGLAHAEIKGRERVLRFKMSKKDLWEEAQQYLRSPVKKRIFARMGAAPWQGFSAGLSALSLSSMLAEPHNPTYALSAAQWKSLRESGAVVEIPMQEPDSVNLEIWTYDPQLFAKNDVVDCLSLFLSLKESEDERVESALESLMEKCKL